MVIKISSLNKPLKTINGQVPLQVWNPEIGDWDLVTPQMLRSQSVDYVAADYITGTSNVTKTFEEDMHGVSILNNGNSVLTFTVNGQTRPVLPKGTYVQNFKEPFQSIEITASGEFHCDILQRQGVQSVYIPPTPPDTEKPTDVTNLNTINITLTSIDLTWDSATDNVGVTGYQVFRDSTLLATVTNTSYQATNLTPNTTYNFIVRARDAAGNVSDGVSIEATTLADTTPPTDVTDLTVSEITDQSAKVTWTASTDDHVVSKYYIYLGDELVGNTTSTNYTLTSLTTKTNYTVSVVAEDASGNQSNPVSTNFTTTSVPPSDVTNLTATPSYTSVDLSWTASASASVVGYNLYKNGVKVNNELITGTSYTVSQLSEGVQYTFVVKAVDDDGVESSGVQVVVTTLTTAELLISDSFDRADTNISNPASQTLGQTDTGQIWTNTSTFLAYGIANDQAYLQYIGTGGTKHRNPVTVPFDVEVANYAVEVTFATVDSGTGNETLAVRVTNDGMIYAYLHAGSRTMVLSRLLNTGSPVQLMHGNTVVQSGDRIRAEYYSGGQIYLYINGVLELASVDTNLPGTSVKVGFAAENTNSRFDDFKVYSLPELNDTTPPADLADFTVSNINSNGFTASYSLSSSRDAYRYHLYIDDELYDTKTPNSMLTPGTVFTVTGLDPSTTYEVTLIVEDVTGNMSSGITKNVTTSA